MNIQFTLDTYTNITSSSNCCCCVSFMSSNDNILAGRSLELEATFIFPKYPFFLSLEQLTEEKDEFWPVWWCFGHDQKHLFSNADDVLKHQCD